MPYSLYRVERQNSSLSFFIPVPCFRRNWPFRRCNDQGKKIRILRRHLLNKVPMSDFCDKLGLYPNVFYSWREAFLKNGAAAFDKRTPSRSRKLEQTSPCPPWSSPSFGLAREAALYDVQVNNHDSPVEQRNDLVVDP